MYDRDLETNRAKKIQHDKNLQDAAAKRLKEVAAKKKLKKQQSN